MNWCQEDGFSSMGSLGTQTGAIKLAMGLVAPISSIVGLLILYGLNVLSP